MRKTFILTIAVLCFASVSNAQIRKGATFLGGSLGFSAINSSRTQTSPTPSNPSSKSENKSIAVFPAVGWAVKDNSVFGAFFSYSKNSSEGNSNYYNNSYRTTGGGVFLRRYFPAGKKFYAFGQANLGYADIHNEQIGPLNFASTFKTDGWNVYANLNPGLAYQVSKSFFLEAGIGNLFSVSYGKDKTTEQAPNGTVASVSESKNFGISTSLSGSADVNIGFRFIIPHK